MSDTAQIIIAVLSTLGTIGAGAGVHFVQARKSRDAGVKSEDVQSQPSATTPDPLDVFRSLVADLSAEIQRLREDRDEDRAEIAALRTDQKRDRAAHQDGMREMRSKHDTVVEENRRFRDVILAVMEQLRRIPPPEHSDILAYILKHLPGLGKDHTP